MLLFRHLFGLSVDSNDSKKQKLRQPYFPDFSSIDMGPQTGIQKEERFLQKNPKIVFVSLSVNLGV